MVNRSRLLELALTIDALPLHHSSPLRDDVSRIRRARHVVSVPGELSECRSTGSRAGLHQRPDRLGAGVCRRPGSGHRPDHRRARGRPLSQCRAGAGAAALRCRRAAVSQCILDHVHRVPADHDLLFDCVCSDAIADQFSGVFASDRSRTHLSPHAHVGHHRLDRHLGIVHVCGAAIAKPGDQHRPDSAGDAGGGNDGDRLCSAYAFFPASQDPARRYFSYTFVAYAGLYRC